jgi:tetratricopeptide (TPR) repeat protein
MKDNWEDREELECELNDTNEKLKSAKRKGKQRKAFPRTACCSHNRTKEREVASMTTPERLKSMYSFRKDYGNVLFQDGKFIDALQWYEKSLIYSEYCFPKKNEEATLNQERVHCLLNASACFLELREYSRCIEYCTEALDIAQGTTKAFFRRSKAQRCLCNFEEAKNDIELARKFTSKLSERAACLIKVSLDEEEVILNNAVKAYESQSQQFAKRMLQLKI